MSILHENKSTEQNQLYLTIYKQSNNPFINIIRSFHTPIEKNI